MAKKIIWTKRATRSFEKILDYLDAKWSEKVKADFIIRTFDVIEILSEFPEIGTLENPERNIRGFLLTRHNRIFYKYGDESIVILNIFDVRQNKKRKF